MDLQFSGEIWYWRGPSPFHFVTVPDEESADIQEMASSLTYGWGMIPVTVTIGKTSWYTALWPKDGRYIVPIKAAIRKKEQIDLGDVVTVHLTRA
jgi:hypothetical protein